NLLAELLDVYLSWPNMEQAKQLINNRILDEDLGPDSRLIDKIESYLNNPPAGNDPNSLLEPLRQIEIPENRPKWAEQIRKWSERFIIKLPEPNTPEEY
ncbi:unnamed protein product, partial [marine sediment metagenome]